MKKHIIWALYLVLHFFFVYTYINVDETNSTIGNILQIVNAFIILLILAINIYKKENTTCLKFILYIISIGLNIYCIRDILIFLYVIGFANR
jgi:uncharacterized membrane protein